MQSDKVLEEFDEKSVEQPYLNNIAEGMVSSQSKIHFFNGDV
jgi:hypothetical protein